MLRVARTRDIRASLCDFWSHKLLCFTLPIKRLSSCLLHSGGIEPQNADTTRHAFTTDFETGKPLEAMPATIYEAF